MKKKIITNSILFILIISFITGFKTVFGEENMLLGVGILTLSLILVERDLTIHPVKNTFKLMVINLGLGVFAYVAHLNMWLGIPLNFIALFLIGYKFSYNLRKSVVLPFGLTYLFMLYQPVVGAEILTRVVALIAGALITMGLQLLLNKNKFSRVGIKGVEDIYINILTKIENIKQEKSTQEIDKIIQANIKAVKKVILDKRAKDFYLTQSGEALTDLVWNLERISILLEEYSEISKISSSFEKQDYKMLLDKLYNNIENILANQPIHSKLKDKDIDEFDELIIKLSSGMEDVLQWNEEGLGLDKMDVKVPDHFDKIRHHRKDLSLKSIRFSFGLRLGIVATATAIITQYFGLTQGKWMAYTAFVLVQPYYENCRTKAKHRVEGTLIGALIVLLSFSVIKDNNARLGVVLIAGYLNPFFTNYRNITTVVTVSAIASAALVGGTMEFIIARVGFVILGTAISMFANKFILPFKIEDGKKDLVEKYNQIARHMIRDIKNAELQNHSIKSLFLLPSLIEDRMHLLDFGTNCHKENQIINDKKVLINNIYKHYISLEEDRESQEDIIEMVKAMEKTLNQEPISQ